MLSRYVDNIKQISEPDGNILNEIIRININRVFYLAIVMIVMRILMIIIFLNMSPAQNEVELIWQNGIIISHAIYLALLLIIGAVSYALRKQDKPNLLTIIVQYALPLVILLLSAIIVSLDQLVTNSITPFLIACIAVGIIFIIKPLHSLILFMFGYMVYFFAIGIMQPDLAVLLSNRMNGLTAIMLGLFVSIILWRSNVVNLRQKRHIKYQQTELEAKNKELYYLATYDFLTELINRRYFEEIVNREISRIKRYGQKSCLLILDIDNFKSINDRFGHPAGDIVLKRFARLLKSLLRETDVIARIGGEEFAILLINVNEEVGREVAEKIRQRITEENFILDGQGISITVSIGISLLDSRMNSYEESYVQADRALYNAKSLGKNRVEVEIKA